MLSERPGGDRIQTYGRRILVSQDGHSLQFQDPGKCAVLVGVVQSCEPLKAERIVSCWERRRRRKGDGAEGEVREILGSEV